MALYFLDVQSEREAVSISERKLYLRSVQERRSYCANSELFSSHTPELRERELSDEEAEYRASCYRALCD